MTIDLEEPEGTGGNTLDEARVEAFAERLFELYVGGLLTYMIDLGYRTGAVRGGPPRDRPPARSWPAGRGSASAMCASGSGPW